VWPPTLAFLTGGNEFLCCWFPITIILDWGAAGGGGGGVGGGGAGLGASWICVIIYVTWWEGGEGGGDYCLWKFGFTFIDVVLLKLFGGGPLL